LIGGPDNDVLVGGEGSDRLVGSSGHDILFANELIGRYQENGTLESFGAFDGAAFWNNYELLRALSLFWTLGLEDDHAEEPEIYPGNDHDSDDLTGGSGRDWFFVDEGDVVTDLDLESGDRATES
jgi:Ca2+-binding RTX toxin-like protein